MDVNKPITVIRDDFIKELTTLINDCMLPPFIIEPILKDMYMETKLVAQKQLEKDKYDYKLKLSRSTDDRVALQNVNEKA